MMLRLRWPWRFTHCSLFVATTLLAVVLELMASLDHAGIGRRDPPMFQCLRIAASLTCFVACLAFISLWVRSCDWHDELNGHTPDGQALLI
jgi:hypothetical protein